MWRSRVGALALLAACGGADGGDEGFAERDSAGIRIAESVVPSPAGPPALAAQPRLDIGLREGEAEYLLGRVVHAVRRADGSIAVADGAASTIRVYDPQGVHLRSFGGAGDGPREFRNIAGLWLLPDDSLGVYDSRHGRISIVAPDGSFVREVTLSPRQLTVAVLPLADGSTVAMVAPPPRPGGADGTTRPMAAIVHHDPAGVLRDTVREVPGPQMQMVEIPGGFARGPVPYGANSYAALSGDTVVIGTAAACELLRVRVDGTLLGAVRWPCNLTLTDADAARWREHMRRTAETNGPGSVADLQPFIDRAVFPSSRAAYGAFLAAADGSIWLPEPPLPGDDPVVWTVLDASGRLLGDITMPDRFVPLDVGRDYVLGRWSDELDVQHVRLYDLVAR